MKTFLFTFGLVLFSMSSMFGQPTQLVLTHTANHTVRTIQNGKKIKVYKGGYYYIKGKLNLIDSVTIAVGKDTIALSEILGMKANTTGNIITGTVLTAVGSVILIAGIGLVSEGSDIASYGYFFPVYGAEVTGVGIVGILAGTAIAAIGIVNLTEGKHFSRSKNWEFSVR